MTTQAIAREEIKISEGVSTSILLFLLLTSMTGSIITANWADGLGILNWAAIAGLTLGITLAKLHVRGRVAHPFMLVTGVPAIVALTTMVFSDALTFREKLLIIQERVEAWTLKIMAGGVGTDNLIFVIQLAFLMWVIAYIAAWFVYRRHQAWGAIVPTGAGLLINLFHAQPQTGFYFGIYIFSALLLLVRLNLHALERWWHRAAIGYTTDISFDFLLYGTLFVVLLMILVWLLPASPPGPAWISALDPLQGPWQEIEDQFNRVFSTLRAAAHPALTTFFGTTLSMGGPITLGNRPVMDIQTNAGRYWRAAVYDSYSGIGWINTHLDSMSLDANDPRLESSHEYLRVEVTQTVKIYLHDQNILYAHSQPIRFSLPVEVRYGHPPASDAASLMFDVAFIRARRPLREGDTYTAVSTISVADEDSLRGDSIRYSDWITTTYLQLPDDLPVRVRRLAKEVTGPYTNPYDKAAAIEKYLRTKIKYNETINPPPAGHDGVDYLLFDRPEGYCNYYASAMVVMARAVGIPARIASGYSLGDYHDSAFHIIESDAHSWVEVYFPSYGWIEFEPTANKPEVERPKQAEPVPFNPDLEDAASEARRRGQREKDLGDLGEDVEPGGFAFVRTLWNESLLLALGGSVVALLAAATLTITLVKRTRRMARLAPAARVYEQMLERARWLGIHEQGHATPFERAHAIGIALPQAQKETEHMASSYTRERFGARKIDAAERAALAAAWEKWRAEWRLRLIALIVGRITALSRAAIEQGRALVVRRRSLSSAPQTKEE